MTTILILFALAAVGGVILAGQRLSGKPQPSLAIALVHGAVAATALLMLILFVTGAESAGYASIALVLFLVAALGGFLLFSFHLRKRPLPVPIVIVHGLVAVSGFLSLLFGFLS